MGSGQYERVNVTLSAATFSRLEKGNPFNKRRVADQALEMIRVALLSMYPPRAPEEWNDRSRYQGAGRHILLYSYDMICYLVRRLPGRAEELGRYANHVSDEQITLRIPIGLMSWIKRIARDNQSTIPEATVSAIEYGLRVLDLQKTTAGSEALRNIWREIVLAIRKRFEKGDRI